MRFVHRIGLRMSASQRRELEALGVKVPGGTVMPGGGDPLCTFDVGEEHQGWPVLQGLFAAWNVSDSLRTIFSTEEINSARWLEIGAWHHGYPQPDQETFGYLKATYDLSDWCAQCGVGKKQNAPFQMAGEPKWGKHGILQLTWVYDELFVTPEVWTTAFKPFDVMSREVLSTKKTALSRVVQLVVEDEVSIVSEGLPFERCSKCGRVKYLPVARGAFPALAETPVRAIARTKEYFGSGAQADQRIVVSQRLSHALAFNDVQGAVLRPVKSD